jgi:hypothetical protein
MPVLRVVRVIAVRQWPISALGAPRTPLWARKTTICVLLFGEIGYN